MFRCASFVLALTVAVISQSVEASAQLNQGLWTDKAPTAVFPFLSRHGACGVGGSIFIFGGINFPVSPGTFQTTTYEYVPATNTVTTLASVMNGQRERFAYSTGTFAGVTTIFVFGGTSNGGALAAAPVLRFNTATKSWTTFLPGPNLPTARYDVQCVTDGSNLIHILGGRGITGTQDTLTTHEIYDANANVFLGAGAPMPRDSKGVYLGFVNNKIYMAGGTSLINFPTNPAVPTTRIDSYDPGTLSWTSNVAFLNEALADGGYCVFKNRMWIVCGTAVPPGSGTGLLREFHAASNLITARPTSTVTSFWGPAAVCNGLIYSCCGAAAATETAGVERMQEYTPPQFGPNNPVAGSVFQRTQNGPNIPTGGVIGKVAEFGCDITDPDSSDQARFEVEVVPWNAAGTGYTGNATGVGSFRNTSPSIPVQIIVTHAPLVNGSYMWRYRAVDPKGDTNLGTLPNGWSNFGTLTDLDFTVNIAVVFSSENKSAGDGIGPACSVGTTGGSLMGLFFGLMVLAGITQRRK